MKRVALVVLTFVFAVNSFSQTQSHKDSFNKFWELAKKNDFETAKTQIESAVLASDKIEQIKQNFQAVSANDLKLIDFRLTNINLNRAFFTVATKDKNGQEGFFQMTMTKIKDDWKISAFDYQVIITVNAIDTDSNSTNQNQPFGQNQKENKAQILPLEPYNEKKNPATFLAEPYNEKKNPVSFQFIVPKPK